MSWMFRMGRALGQSSVKNNLRFLLGKEVCVHSFGLSSPCNNRNTSLSMAVSSRRASTLTPVVGRPFSITVDILYSFMMTVSYDAASVSTNPFPSLSPQHGVLPLQPKRSTWLSPLIYADWRERHAVGTGWGRG